MELTDLIAGLASEPVVVFGSLPPHGRDLDLLVGAGQVQAIESGLAESGFERQGRIWARFGGCNAEIVELAPAESWGLPEDELEALFAESRPIEPSGLVCRPAPHHALLILARRVMREGPRLRERRRERVAAELGEDPDAFEAARPRAPGWGASASLEALEAAFRSGDPIAQATRRRAIAEQLRGQGRLRERVGPWRAVLRRPRRGAVIAFSGLDGCGKSSQAAGLAETLDRLGLDTTLVWTSVAFHPPWLGRGARAVKRALARGRAGGGPVDVPPGAPRGSDDPGKVMRSRSAVLTFAWSMVVTTLLAFEVVRKLWPPLARGRVVVCDRHLLDAWAHLLYQYGEERRYGIQMAILRTVFRRPMLAYFLDIPPEVAAARKQEFSAEQNARRAAIYRDRAQQLGVRVLDGERPLEEICAEVAREAWAALA